MGTTQYIDAFQRANFWKYVSGTAPKFHVRFHLTVAPVQTLMVPAYFGYTSPGPGSPIGYVYYNWWDGQLGMLLYKLRIKISTLPIFLNYNIEQYSTDFTYAGYHTAFGDPAQGYISAGFFDDRKLEDTAALVVLIGRVWLDCKDAQGRLRLENPADFVRLEVATALRRKVRVIPVLLDGASMPASQQLPRGIWRCSADDKRLRSVTRDFTGRHEVD